MRRYSRSIALSDLSGLPTLQCNLLLERGSLTRRLKAQARERFALRVETEGWGTMSFAEARRLGVRPGRQAWIREVTLCCDGVPLVYARSIMPTSTYRTCHARLGRLGTRPLGELLFRHRAARRDNMTVFRLRRGSALYDRARALGGKAADLWGRQSVFRFHGRDLLLTEILLR